jgi:hypothetical protein
MALTDRILDYYNHFSESAFLDELAAENTAADLFDALNQLLVLPDRDKVGTTLIFIQDMLRYYPGEERDEFGDKFLSSSVVQTLESLLVCPNRSTRTHTMDVIQRTCGASSAAALEKAFWKFHTIDPILLPDLLCLFGYMADEVGSDRFNTMLGSMVLSPHYPIRWGAVYVIAAETDQKYQSWLQQLRQDNNLCVQQAAEYCYQQQVFELIKPNLPKAERRKQKKQLEKQYVPSLTFDIVGQQFAHHLYTEGFEDYTIEQFEAFVEQLGQSRAS